MWSWRRKPHAGGFPDGFRVQRIGVEAAKELATLPPKEIARSFRERPWVARALLDESYDKRYAPSTFIKEDGDKFSEGWLSRDAEYECEREFKDLADAATDYLLFSRGKGRWKPEPNSE